VTAGGVRPLSPPRRRGISPLGYLRVGLRVAGLGALLSVSVPSYYAWRSFTRRNPWPRLFLGGAGAIMGLRISVRGRVASRGSVLLANHVSWLDIPALSGRTGSAFVAHDGLAAHPVLRWLCSLNETVFVARHERSAVARQVEQIRLALKETGALTIFPEGGIADPATISPFKSSLLSATAPVPDGIAVQPVWLDYGPDTGKIAWIGEERGLDNFVKIAAHGGGIRLTVHFLPPLTGPALASRKSIAAAAYEAIAARKREVEAARDQRVAL